MDPLTYLLLWINNPQPFFDGSMMWFVQDDVICSEVYGKLIRVEPIIYIYMFCGLHDNEINKKFKN